MEFIKAIGVKPGQLFDEVRKMPGSSSQEGETRINYFRRGRQKRPVIVNGLSCIHVLSYGYSQGKIVKVQKKGVPCRLIANVPVVLRKKKFCAPVV